MKGKRITRVQSLVLTVHRSVDPEEERAERLQSLSVIPDFDDSDEDDEQTESVDLQQTLRRSPPVPVSK